MRSSNSLSLFPLYLISFITRFRQQLTGSTFPHCRHPPQPANFTREKSPNWAAACRTWRLSFRPNSPIFESSRTVSNLVLLFSLFAGEKKLCYLTSLPGFSPPIREPAICFFFLLFRKPRCWKSSLNFFEFSDKLPSLTKTVSKSAAAKSP